MLNSRCRSFIGSALGVAALLAAVPYGRAQAPAAPEGVEVQARGPVHEAFAESVGGGAKEAPLVAKQPPAPIEEMPPDQKPEGDNVQWIPGYWAFDEEKTDFLWVSGFWRVPPPGRQWTPGHWKGANDSWQWVAGFWTVQAQADVTYLPPPPAPLEVSASVPAPSADHFYVPGSWVYRETRYVWRPGFWCVCRPNWVWVPAHYVWSPCGYVFVDGYWDYTLRDRGLLFAPVCIDVTVCRRPGFVYTPCYVVHDECLVGSLFVRPGFSCYYFGDYYEPCYRRSGFVAFCDVRVGIGCGDPLFSYYRWSNRGDVSWEVSLRAGYVGRYNGDVPRPPRTLVQQTTIVNNITNVNNTTINNTNVNNTTINNTKNVNNVKNVTMLTSLNQVSKTTNIKLQPVAPAQQLEVKKSAQQLVVASQQRGQTETQLLAKGPPPTKPTDAPRVAKLDLPKMPVTTNAQSIKAPPPQPTHSEAKPLGKPAAVPELKPAPLPGQPVQPTIKPQPALLNPNTHPQPLPVNPTVHPQPLAPNVHPQPLAPNVVPQPLAPNAHPQPMPQKPDVHPLPIKPMPHPLPVKPDPRPDPKQKPDGKQPMAARPEVKGSPPVTASAMKPAVVTPATVKFQLGAKPTVLGEKDKKAKT